LFETQQQEDAAETRLDPLLRQLQEAQQRAEAARTRVEEAVARANRRHQELSMRLERDGNARAVARALLKSDSGGLFARMLRA